MKLKGLLEAWQLVPVKKNWRWFPKQDSFFQRALECGFNYKRLKKKIAAHIIGNIAAGTIRFRDVIAIHNTLEKVRPDTT